MTETKYYLDGGCRRRGFDLDERGPPRAGPSQLGAPSIQSLGAQILSRSERAHGEPRCIQALQNRTCFRRPPPPPPGYGKPNEISRWGPCHAFTSGTSLAIISTGPHHARRGRVTVQPKVRKLARSVEPVHGGCTDGEPTRDVRDRQQRLVLRSPDAGGFQQQASSKFSAICC
jgi:hypothetical protein